MAEPDLFRVFQATPLLGRFYGADDNRVGAPSVAVISEGLRKRQSLAGLLFGIRGSILLGRGLESLLFEVRASDPLTFVTVAAVVGLGAMLSSYLPGREAARTAPATALRQK